MSGEHEYVELEVTVDAGQVVSCREFGKGQQADPLTEPVVYLRAEDGMTPMMTQGFERIRRRILRALSDV